MGKRLFLRITTPEPEWYDVIGVVGHQRHASLAVPGPEAIFILNGHGGHGAAARWAVRTTGDPVELVPAVRAAVAQIDPRAPLAEVQPMTAFVDKAMAPVRFTSTLIGIFAVVAVLLAAIGLYGVLSTIVRQRTAEIGMRMVFGAQRGTILQLIVGEGLRLSAAGIGLGLIAAAMVHPCDDDHAGRRDAHRPGDIPGNCCTVYRDRGGGLVAARAPRLPARSHERLARRVRIEFFIRST